MFLLDMYEVQARRVLCQVIYMYMYMYMANHKRSLTHCPGSQGRDPGVPCYMYMYIYRYMYMYVCLSGLWLGRLLHLCFFSSTYCIYGSFLGKGVLCNG